MKDYQEFLASKATGHQPTGFEAPPQTIGPMLFPFQHDVARWSLNLGKAAVFLECGLGKTPIQLEWGHHVAQYTGRPTLILAPLAVANQTVQEGEKFNRPVTYCRNQAQADAAGTAIIIANYEMLEHFNPAAFGGITLDESSILKAYTGVIKQTIIESFKRTEFKLACTATPAPNDHLELGNHAEFLGIMRSNEMISRWFINDSMEAGSYRLKGHAAQDFWRWLTSWAVCLSKPSDLGYSDEGYELPPLVFHDHVLGVDHTRAWSESDHTGQMSLLLTGRTSATAMHKEKRATLEDRMAAAAQIVGENPAVSWVIWCNTNYEADELVRRIPEAAEVRGSDSPDEKSRKLTDFATGRVQRIITKPSIAGFGMNWQHCAHHIFTSIDHKFEAFYQAIRRSWRFGQTQPVHAHLVYAESEGDILANVKRKQADHTKMQQEMVRAMRENGLSLHIDRRPAASHRRTAPMQLPAWL